MPEDPEEAKIWMDLLTDGHYQGCGHIKLMMEFPDLYGYGTGSTKVNLLDVPKVCLFVFVVVVCACACASRGEGGVVRMCCCAAPPRLAARRRPLKHTHTHTNTDTALSPPFVLASQHPHPLFSGCCTPSTRTGEIWLHKREGRRARRTPKQTATRRRRRALRVTPHYYY